MRRLAKNRSLEYYLSLDYPIEVTRSEKGYVAEYTDLPGCIAQGKTGKEAVERLKAGREAWFKVALELGLSIPLPNSTLPELEVKEPLPKWNKEFKTPTIRTFPNLCLEQAA
jgi:predicted RNase H-like HicB family nuclease